MHMPVLSWPLRGIMNIGSIGNFVRWLVSWTNNTKLLPFKLSKINGHHLIISLGFPMKSKTLLDHLNDHLDSHFIISINVPSLSGCFLSKLENHLDHLVRLISGNGRIIPHHMSLLLIFNQHSILILFTKHEIIEKEEALKRTRDMGYVNFLKSKFSWQHVGLRKSPSLLTIF